MLRVACFVVRVERWVLHGTCPMGVVCSESGVCV